jgi:hypothetical protein
MIIYQALSFLKNQLNSYLKFQLGDEYADTAFISNPVGQDGSAAADTGDRILLTLTNVEEERIGKIQSPPFKSINGQEVRVNPDIKLNLYILFIANRNKYEESLKFISHVITFFQGKNVFTTQNSPELDPQISKIIAELSTVSYEQLNNLWGAIGAKYMPSVLYKIRMLTVQSDVIIDSPTKVSVPEIAM